MSNKFTRLTIDFMHDEISELEVLDYIVSLVETVDEECEYVGTFEVVAATSRKVELKEVGPAFNLRTVKPTSALVVEAEPAEIDEPTDELADDINTF